MGLFFDKVKQKRYNTLTELFCKELIDENKSSVARKYLAERNINRDLIKKFNIGYCPEGEDLPGQLSFLPGRIVFPVIDEFGNTVAFSGRFPKKKGEIDKRERIWFHESFPKTFFPYGLNLAWKNILRKNSAIIVEGQADVIAMWRCGFVNTVGVFGGAFTDESITKLSRYTSNFITIFDGDEAGRAAAQRTTDFLKDYEPSGYNHLDVNLRIGKKEYDPDEFLKKYDPKQLLKLIKKTSMINKKKKEKQKIEELIS